MRDTYESPLSSRYADKEMKYLFSPDMKFKTWRRLWIALAESEMELGLPVTQEQVDELKAHAEDINYEVAEERERLLWQIGELDKRSNVALRRLISEGVLRLSVQAQRNTARLMARADMYESAGMSRLEDGDPVFLADCISQAEYERQVASSTNSTKDNEPAPGTEVKPMTWTGRDGVASLTCLPCSSSIARTRP